MFIIFIITIFTIVGIYFGRYLFGGFFNHITIYTVIWGGMLFFYHLGFIKYYPLSLETWTYIILAYISLILGTVTVLVGRNIFHSQKPHNNVNSSLNYEFLQSKKIKNIIIIYSLIGLFSGIQHWMILLKMYGTIPNILLHGSEIYRMRVEHGIPGIIPYIHSFSFVALLLAGMYTAVKRSFKLFIILPFLGVIIKQLANFSRAGVLLGFIIFVTSYFLTKNLFSIKTKNKSIKRNFITIVVIVSLLLGSAIFIRAFRGTVESFSGSSRALNSLRSNLVISPSIYLYMSSHVGVFNKYLKLNEEESEVIGKNTFLPVYNILSKLGVVKRFKQYQRGYYIPVWTNTGTYLRELHSDFGIAGILLVPYLLGMSITILINSAREKKNIIYLTFAIYLLVIIIISFLVMVSRLGVYYFSLIIALPTLAIIAKQTIENNILFNNN